MKIVFKVQIILSLLAASAFSIIGLEPSRAGNKLIERYGSCRLMKITDGNGIFKVKKDSGLLVHETSSKKEGRYILRNAETCKNSSGKQ